jgi:RsiW-degrading membrane proteinase PrsW (M82 family)
MDDMIYLLFISIFVPIMLMANLIEKKARLPIVFVLTGMFISVFAAEVNGVLQAVLPLSHYELTIIVTPISEEVLKALPILFYALVKSDKQEILFTASMATGIGFAVLENAYYLLNAETWNVMDAVIRAFGAGLMHGMCTLLVGVGITFVKKKRKVFWVGTFALLSTAITYHSIYNMLVQSRYDVIGYLLPISTYIPSLVWRVKKHVKTSNMKNLR